MPINIIKQTGTTNTTYLPNRSIDYLFIHYAANTSSRRGAAQGIVSWCANPSAGGSADFAVDDETFYQYNGDIKNRYCWAVGGSKYSNLSTNLAASHYGKATNKNSISIEMASNKKNTKSLNVTDNDWYLTDATINNCVALAVYLMKQYNIKPDHVLMHHQTTGKWCPQPWTKNEEALAGWYDFKKRLQKAYDGTDYIAPSSMTENIQYRVRLNWDLATSQKGAFVNLDNAKACAEEYPGYSVFDNNGKCLYTSKKPSGTLASDFYGLTESQKAAKILELVHSADDSGILWSVTAAQMILESGYISTDLAINAANCFGMKASLSGNTWKTVWDGKSTYTKQTAEQTTAGKVYYVTAAFRKYPRIEDSIKDHSLYLLGAMNGNKLRYAGLLDCKDYKSAITLIRNSGYATDVNYISKICNIIERYDLDKYDKELITSSNANKGTQKPSSAAPTQSTTKPATTSKKTFYRVQVGCFSTIKKRDKLIKKIKKKLDFDCFYEKVGGNYYVYCGSFQDRNVAVQRVTKLKSNKFDAFIKPIS